MSLVVCLTILGVGMSEGYSVSILGDWREAKLGEH